MPVLTFDNDSIDKLANFRNQNAVSNGKLEVSSNGLTLIELCGCKCQVKILFKP